MSKKRYKSVWDALEDDPIKAERLKMQSSLMSGIEAQVQSWGITQSEAASRLGISQPRLNDLLKGKFSKFRLDGLIKIALSAGLDVQVKVKSPGARKSSDRSESRAA